MNPTSKKFITLFLVFSLITINCSTLKNLERKREERKKHGALLMIQKIDGGQIKGELIAVKQNSLLLLDSATRADVSIDSGHIKVITIVKKSKVLKGISIGGAMGGMIGAIISAVAVAKEEKISAYWLFLFPLFLSAPGFYTGVANVAKGALIGIGTGVVIGGIVGAGYGIDKTIRIEGRPDSEIQEILDKLRKKARIPDYK